MQTLNALVVTPLSGPLARYGRQTASALKIWADAAGDVRLEVRDAHPDPAKALREEVGVRTHLIFGPYGSGPTIAAARATDRLLWNHGGATSRLTWDRFPRVVNVPSPASTYFEGSLRAVAASGMGASSVVLFTAETGFASDVAAGAERIAHGLGFEVVRQTFEKGRAKEATSAVPDGDVLLVAGGFADELAAADVLLGRDWRAAGFVGAGVEEVLASLGPRRERLLGPAQWIASAAQEPDVGPDAAWFVRAFLRETGNEPAYPAVQAFAAGVLCHRCVTDAGAPVDQAVMGMARRLRCRTLYGDFRLDQRTGLQTGHRVLTVQWQQGRRRVVWPPEQAERQIR